MITIIRQANTATGFIVVVTGSDYKGFYACFQVYVKDMQGKNLPAYADATSLISELRYDSEFGAIDKFNNYMLDNPGQYI